MKIDEFIREFAEQFDETDAAVFKEDTKYKNLEEWSSLMVMCIIAMVDEKYNVKLNGDDFKNSDTILDLLNVVEAKNI